MYVAEVRVVSEGGSAYASMIVCSIAVDPHLYMLKARSKPHRPTLVTPKSHHLPIQHPHTPQVHISPRKGEMATMDKQKENLERVTDFVEERQLDADRMAQVGGWVF